MRSLKYKTLKKPPIEIFPCLVVFDFLNKSSKIAIENQNKSVNNFIAIKQLNHWKEITALITLKTSFSGEKSMTANGYGTWNVRQT